MIAPETYKLDINGFHKQNYIFTISVEAALKISNINGFHLFGTSWKSLDYQPNSRKRPIHDIILKNGIAMENLDLLKVPSGNYFMTCNPIPVENSSEGLVSPMLFTSEEIKSFI